MKPRTATQHHCVPAFGCGKPLAPEQSHYPEVKAAELSSTHQCKESGQWRGRLNRVPEPKERMNMLNSCLETRQATFCGLSSLLVQLQKEAANDILNTLQPRSPNACLSVSVSVCLHACSSVCLSDCLSVSLCVCVWLCLSPSLSPSHLSPSSSWKKLKPGDGFSRARIRADHSWW